MSVITPQSWSSLSSALISESGIREQHQPPEDFKIYVNSYTSGQVVEVKAAHAFSLYVIKGDCRFNPQSLALTLSTGQYLRLDSGSYQCIAGDQGLSIVKVFSRL